jgi:hypothetical protein
MDIMSSEMNDLLDAFEAAIMGEGTEPEPMDDFHENRREVFLIPGFPARDFPLSIVAGLWEPATDEMLGMVHISEDGNELVVTTDKYGRSTVDIKGIYDEAVVEGDAEAWSLAGMIKDSLEYSLNEHRLVMIGKSEVGLISSSDEEE